jgi:hypothetical protein
MVLSAATTTSRTRKSYETCPCFVYIPWISFFLSCVLCPVFAYLIAVWKCMCYELFFFLTWHQQKGTWWGLPITTDRAVNADHQLTATKVFSNYWTLMLPDRSFSYHIIDNKCCMCQIKLPSPKCFALYSRLLILPSSSSCSCRSPASTR